MRSNSTPGHWPIIAAAALGALLLLAAAAFAFLHPRAHTLPTIPSSPTPSPHPLRTFAHLYLHKDGICSLHYLKNPVTRPALEALGLSPRAALSITQAWQAAGPPFDAPPQTDQPHVSLWNHVVLAALQTHGLLHPDDPPHAHAIITADRVIFVLDTVQTGQIRADQWTQERLITQMRSASMGRRVIVTGRDGEGELVIQISRRPEPIQQTKPARPVIQIVPHTQVKELLDDLHQQLMQDILVGAPPEGKISG